MYAKDVLDIDAFSSIRGVEIEQNDEEFATKFSTGACSKPWQEEVSTFTKYITLPDYLATRSEVSVSVDQSLFFRS